MVSPLKVSEGQIYIARDGIRHAILGRFGFFSPFRLVCEWDTTMPLHWDHGSVMSPVLTGDVSCMVCLGRSG